MLIVKLYDDVGRLLDPDNMAWPVIKRFLEQWKALMERKRRRMGHPPRSQRIKRFTSGLMQKGNGLV
jgi:hypothetical protein